MSFYQWHEKYWFINLAIKYSSAEKTWTNWKEKKAEDEVQIKCYLLFNYVLNFVITQWKITAYSKLSYR